MTLSARQWLAIAAAGTLLSTIVFGVSGYHWFAVERHYAGSVIARPTRWDSGGATAPIGGSPRSCHRIELGYRVGDAPYRWRTSGCAGLGNHVTDDGGVVLRYDLDDPSDARLAGSTSMHSPHLAGFGFGVLVLLGSTVSLFNAARLPRRGGRGRA